MTTITAPPGVLADRLPKSLLSDVALVVGIAALTAVLAQVRVLVPFSPVPLTGQTLAVLLGAAALGPWRAVAAQGLYVAVGLLGLPVFTGWEGGVAHAAGVTGGYLAGFVVASAVVGLLAARGADRRPVSTALAFAAGTVTIYAVAVPWFMVVTGAGVTTAVWQGAGVFLLGDAIKALLAAGLLPGAWWLASR